MKKVLIVGAGPVGLIIGCYLNKYGIDFDIIDKNTHSTTWSKALSVSPATIKAFHGLGLAGELIAQGKQVQSVYAYYKNRKFLHIDNRRLATCYPFHVSIPQPRTEKILETALAAAGRQVRRGHQLVSWRREGSAITSPCSTMPVGPVPPLMTILSAPTARPAPSGSWPGSALAVMTIRCIL